MRLTSFKGFRAGDQYHLTSCALVAVGAYGQLYDTL